MKGKHFMSASLYDGILVKGTLRYRLNKNFVSPDSVPQEVKDVLTADNIVDENGMIVVDQKVPAASEPTSENVEELEKEGVKLDRVDQPSTDKPEQTPIEQAAPPDGTGSSPAVEVDDSANQTQTTEVGQDATSTSDQVATKDTPAPVAQTAPTQPEQPAPAAPAPTPQAQVPAPATRATAAKEPVEKFRSKVPQSTPGMGFPRKNGKTVDIFDLETPHTHVKLVGGLAVPLSAKSFNEKGEVAIQNRLRELGIETLDFEAQEREEAMSQVAEPSLMLEDDEVDEDIRLG